MEPQIDSETTRAGAGAATTPGLLLLFWVFFVVGATAFGGSMVWLRRTLVEQRRWLTADEFVEALGMSQFLPGPNAFNLIVVLGRRFHGLRGIVCASVGLMIMPFLYALGMGVLYSRYQDLPWVHAAMRGITPVAAGLMLTMGIQTASSRALRSPLAVVAVLTFGAVAFLRLGLPLVLLIMLPISSVLAWRSTS